VLYSCDTTERERERTVWLLIAGAATPVHSSVVDRCHSNTRHRCVHVSASTLLLLLLCQCHRAPGYPTDIFSSVLQRVQNNAARIVLQSPGRSYALPLLKELYWLPMEQHISYSWPRWRLRYGIRQHPGISVGTSEYTAALGHCGHRPFRFDVPFRRTDIGKRSFSCTVHCAYNLELCVSYCYQLWHSLCI